MPMAEGLILPDRLRVDAMPRQISSPESQFDSVPFVNDGRGCDKACRKRAMAAAGEGRIVKCLPSVRDDGWPSARDCCRLEIARHETWEMPAH